MQFQYSATNVDGKSSSGFVNAETFEKAKSQLESMGFKIDYLKQATENSKSNSKFAKYRFKGLNKDAKTVKGTIEAETIEQGIERLINEFELNVVQFGNAQLTDQELEQTENKTLEIVTQIQSRPKPEPKPIQKQSFTVNKEIDYVENLISMINYILNRFDSYLKSTKKSELNETLNIFEKTRYSDNKEQLQNQAKDLINEILNDSLFVEEYDFENSPEINNLHTQATNLLFINDKPIQKTLKSIGIILTTQSNLTRKIIWIELLSMFRKYFQKKPQINSSIKKGFEIDVKLEQKISDIVFIITQAYLAFYFLSYLIGIKLGFNFNIFKTSFLIYAILAGLFIQAGLKFDLLINKKHGTNSIYLVMTFIGIYITLITKI